VTSTHSNRKEDHLRIVLDGQNSLSAISTGFEKVQFEHVALPEIDLADVDVSTRFLDRSVAAPLLISSMTGGPVRAETINRNIAQACQTLRLPFSVGSQRVALESTDNHGLGNALRKIAPDVPIIGNIGAAQLRTGTGPDLAQRAVDMIEADALYIHLNPLQEAVQPEGDRDWSGLLAEIGTVVNRLHVPVAVKEVGFGLSAKICRQLADIGVDILDVAGAGGTNWARVEAARGVNPARARLGQTFADWGIPTAAAIQAARAECPDRTIVGSGGIKSGVDIAKAIRLGADMTGIAAGVLASAVDSTDKTHDHLSMLCEELRIACFCTGSADLAALRQARLISDS
jgi:isopentenyl-diphosphate delta-isomerase